MNTDLTFIKEYHVVNRADPKKYPNPVSLHDISLLEQMGAEVLVDPVLKVVTVLNSKRNRIRRKGTRKIIW